MKTSSAKAKGRRLCQSVVDLLLAAFDTLQPDDLIVTSSGATGEDIRLSPLARQAFPFSVECKNQEKLNIWAALEQAESNCAGFTPLLVFSRNRSKTYAVIEVDKFIEIVKEANCATKNRKI